MTYLEKFNSTSSQSDGWYCLSSDEGAGYRLNVLLREGKILFSIEDLMRGLTLIDLEDTLSRLGESAKVQINNTWWLKDNWLMSMYAMTWNNKVAQFKRWMNKEALPMIRSEINKPVAPTAVQTPAQLTAPKNPTTNAEINTVEKLTKLLRINVATYYKLLRRHNLTTESLRDDRGVFTDSGITRLQELLAAKAAKAKPAKAPVLSGEVVDAPNAELPQIISENPVLEFVSEQFGKVRIVNKDGEPWFVAADVCKALEIEKTDRALSRLDDDEKGTHSVSTLGGIQKMSVVNEEGLYGLVMTSRKPEAKQFKRWVKHEVLPSIRKTGGYIAGEEHLSDDDLVARAWVIVNRKLQLREQEIAELNKKIAADAPKVLFSDAVEDRGENLGLNAFAKMLYNDETPIGRNKLIRWLRANHYFIQGAALPYQTYVNNGWFVVRTKLIPTGEAVAVTLVTPKGQIALTNAFKAQPHLINA